MNKSKSIEEFVAEQLASGEFSSREELVSEALIQMQQRQEEISRLADHMREAAEEIKRGDPGIPFDPEAIVREAKERRAECADEKTAA